MRATVGDRLVIKGHNVGSPNKDGEVLEVHGEDGALPSLADPMGRRRPRGPVLPWARRRD